MDLKNYKDTIFGQSIYYKNIEISEISELKSLIINSK